LSKTRQIIRLGVQLVCDYAQPLSDIGRIIRCVAFLLRPYACPIELSRSLPNLESSVLRPLSQHDARPFNRLADRVGLDNFGSLDVIAFIQEEAAVNVHEVRPVIRAAR
jgi:hypothetical protein